MYEFLGLDKLQELLVTWVCATRKRNIPASSSGQRKPEVLFALVGMELSASYLLGHGFSTELHPLELESHLEAAHNVSPHQVPVSVVARHAGQALLLQHSCCLHHLTRMLQL